ncbi:hypothetical protein V8G54_037028 [Vigna mungo]|uniref:Uncharacterized protein n=1 Tax=Vigna mungo TaxID=3915 RepID=A0AAQ3MJJ4_VIGMU
MNMPLQRTCALHKTDDGCLFFFFCLSSFSRWMLKMKCNHMILLFFFFWVSIVPSNSQPTFHISIRIMTQQFCQFGTHLPPNSQRLCPNQNTFLFFHFFKFFF